MRLDTSTVEEPRKTQHILLHGLVVQRDGDDSAPEHNVRVGDDIRCIGWRNRPGFECQLATSARVNESVRILLSVRGHVDCALL